MRVDQMGVHRYDDDLHMSGRAHVDMGHACRNVISCQEGLIHSTRMWIHCWSHMTYLGQVRQTGERCQPHRSYCYDLMSK